MRNFFKLVSLTCLLLGVPGSLLAQDRAHDLARQAPNQHTATCPHTALTLQQCHNQFPDGCSASARPKYDAYLDFLKNQDPGPTLASTNNLTSANFANLESKLHTKSLTAFNHAKLANWFAGLGEGNLYTVIAYVYFAEDTGQGNPPNSETCNCKLTAPGTFDYHMGLGFDSALAAKARSTHPKEGDPAFSELQKNSVVAEITPYTRHPSWTLARVNVLQGQQVKIVGQLMADNLHFNAADDCSFTPKQPHCWRSTIWELHPVTQFYVCNLSAGCDASSPDSAWTSLDK